jgi:hypothetical protein
MANHMIPGRLPRPSRDPGLDALRGAMQLFIFVSHVPDSWLWVLIHKSWGFSDSSEAFVFLSGMTLGSLFALRAHERGWFAGARELVLRGLRLWFRHIWMTVLFVGFLLWAGDGELHDELALTALFEMPTRAALSALVFAWQPVFMDILPLFVLAMLALPLAMAVPRDKPWLGLLPWALLWLVVQVTGVTPTTWPDGREWAFNPLAWLPLFVFGAWVGRAALFGERLIPRSRALLALALVWLAFAFVVRGSWTLGDIFGLPVPALAESWFWPPTKQHLGWAPLLHALALFYVVAHLVPRDRGPLVGPVGRLIAPIGRVSLDVFCLGLFLSMAARLTHEASGLSPAVLVLVNLVGVATLIGFAHLRARPAASRRLLPSRA